jgi:hypothetical protein
MKVVILDGNRFLKSVCGTRDISATAVGDFY